MFAAKIQKEAYKLVLYRGESSDGQDFYAYIRCDEAQLFRMKRDYNTAAVCVNASDYGEVVYHALGTEPDAQAEKFVEEYMATMAA